jgi:hypothetical protein
MTRLSAILATVAVAAFFALTPAGAFAHSGGGGGGGGHWGGGGGGHWGGGGFRGGFPGRFFGPGLGIAGPVALGFYGYGYPYYYGGGCAWVRRLVPTPYGLRWRLVPVCY